MGKNKFILVMLFKKKLQVLEKVIYDNNGITGPKEQARGWYHTPGNSKGSFSTFWV